jgi:UDP-N-acetylmuramate--alanine ligase
VVGVGGPGMSAIALLLIRMGHTVTGSDIHDSGVIAQLRTAGIGITIGHDANVVRGVDVVTYSTAIPSENVEIAEAHRLGIPVRHRSGMLASLCAATRAVGVAGTHGKTTTSALLATILDAADLRPSSIIGAELLGIGVGASHGDGSLLVIESDESDGTLDVLPLESLIVTNIDVDHLDYFETFEALKQCFADAVSRTTGGVVLNADDAGSADLVQATAHNSRVSTFGTSSQASVRVAKVAPTSRGVDVDLVIDAAEYECHLPLRGDHNALNLAAAVAMAVQLGVAPQLACDAVQSFGGVARRFTERGHCLGALLVDDYAHLPAEIEAAIAAVRTHPEATGRTVAVFQPNRYHRIAAMADTYADCFAGADRVVITDVYASGTEKIDGVTGELVVNAIRSAHPLADVVWAPSRLDTVVAVSDWLKPGDVCISMGCGDIESFPDDLMKAQS